MRRLLFLTGAIAFVALGARADDAPPPQQHAVGIPHTCDRYQPRDLSFGYDGKTTLRFNVMVSGGVSGIEIVKSSGNTELDNAAIDCASHWKYKPATENGQPVEKVWEAAVVWHILPRGAVVPSAKSAQAPEPNPAPNPAPTR